MMGRSYSKANLHVVVRSKSFHSKGGKNVDIGYLVQSWDVLHLQPVWLTQCRQLESLLLASPVGRLCEFGNGRKRTKQFAISVEDRLVLSSTAA